MLPPPESLGAKKGEKIHFSFEKDFHSKMSIWDLEKLYIKTRTSSAVFISCN